MGFDFDRVIDRAGTESSKWDPEVLRKRFGAEDMLSYWVADMDFEVAPAIKRAVVERAAHGIYGYTTPADFNAPFCRWVARRHGWHVESEWVLNTPGVVTALHACVQAFTQPGDAVIIQRPVYYPFTFAVERNGRRVSSNSLIETERGWRIDFDDLERRAADPKATMLILCSPHNPVARVWTPEELRRLMGICLANDVLVVADEIHNDLVMPGYTHHVLAALDEAYADHVVTCMAPSKTFNLAGMQTSDVVVPDEGLRRRLQGVLDRLNVGEQPNPFAAVAVRAAYDEGAEWLDELVRYLAGNVSFVHEWCARNLGCARLGAHEGTYLMWMDLRELGLSDDELRRRVWRGARVALDAGSWFGREGEGFMRMNVACPRAVLQDGLERLTRELC